MKHACLLALACAVVSLSYAGTKTTRIPSAVHKSFSHQYHHVDLKKWDQDDDAFIAIFKADRWKHAAYYAPDGSWIKTATKIPDSRNLPVCVKQSFNCSRFASWRIDGISLIESPDNKYYTMAVYQEMGPEGSIPGDWVDKYVLYFNSEGTIVRACHAQ